MIEPNIAQRRDASLCRLNLHLQRYLSGGRNLRVLIASQGWSTDPASCQRDIDHADQGQTNALWAAVKEQVTAKSLGIGETAEGMIWAARERNMAAMAREVAGEVVG